MRLLLWLISRTVPHADRPRWREEWRAELRHGGWRMLPGAMPDALTLRRIRREESRAVGKKAGIFHAVDQDIRYGMRTLIASRSFTIAVIGSLAIGIGATTAAFTMVNAVLFRPFPKIHAQEELVTVKIAPRQRVWFTTSWNDYEGSATASPRLKASRSRTKTRSPWLRAMEKNRDRSPGSSCLATTSMCLVCGRRSADSSWRMMTIRRGSSRPW